MISPFFDAFITILRLFVTGLMILGGGLMAFGAVRGGWKILRMWWRNDWD